MRSISEMDVKIRWRCSKCDGTGLSGFHRCGVCNMTFNPRRLEVNKGMLKCQHSVMNLVDDRKDCDVCQTTGWVERWVNAWTLKVWLDQGFAR